MRIPLPTRRQWLYVSAMIAALVAIGGVLTTGAALVSKIDMLTAAFAALHDTPQQVQAIAMRSAETERRVTDLESAEKEREGRYTEVKTALQNLADRLDAHTQNLADLKDGQQRVQHQLDNLLDAITGRPYMNSKGREVR